MSTPNPLQPQGALESAAAPKSRVRITVLTILALHVVFIGGLLLQGCDPGDKKGTASASDTNALGALPSLADTNYFTGFPGDAGPGPGGGATTSPSGPGTAYTPPSDLPPLPGTADSGVGAVPGAGTSPGGVHSGASLGGGLLPPPVVAAQGTEHVIKKGDLIKDLARKYGVTEQAILDANPAIKPRSLKINDRLIIPAPQPGAGQDAAGGSGAGLASDAARSGEVYVVQQGDNLTKIAKKFGVTVKALRAANGLKSDRILPKQRLTIPAKAPAPAATASSGGGTGQPL